MWLRKRPLEGKSDLILYDWELCCIHVPQRDVVTFLMVTTLPQSSPSEQLNYWKKFTDFYHEQLLASIQGREEHLIERIKDNKNFDRIMYLQVIEALLNRACLMAVVPEKDTPESCITSMENLLLYIESNGD